MARMIATSRISAGTRQSATNRFVVRDMDKCLNFRSPVSTDLIEVANTESLRPTTAVTLSALVRLRTYGGNSFGRIIDIGDGAQVGFFVSGVNTPVKSFQLSLGGTAYQAPTNTLTERNFGKWVLICATYDKSLGSQQVKLYVNSVLVGTGTRTTDIPTSESNKLYVGNRATANRQFDGNMREIRLWKNYALTQAEIEDLYYRGIVANRGALSLELMLDETSGTTAPDTSGNGNNGTITGATWATGGPIKLRTSV